MNVTQQMIADRVGVTRATVSMALRNDPQVSAKRREEILRVAGEMEYRPNALVSSLMSHVRLSRPVPKRTGLLYLVSGNHAVPGEAGDTPELCFRGAVHQAEKLGFHLEPFWIRQPGLTDRRINDIVRSRNIPGVIVGPREDEFPLPELEWDRLASVMISQSFTEPGLDRVFTHFFNSTRLALRHIDRQREADAKVRLILPSFHDRNVHHLWAASYRQEQVGKPHLLEPLIYDISDPAEVLNWVEWNQAVSLKILGTNPVLDLLLDGGMQNGCHFRFFSLNVENRTEITGIREASWEVGVEAANQVISRICLNQRGIPPNPHSTLIEPGWQEGRMDKTPL